jgi:hypothetical protein
VQVVLTETNRHVGHVDILREQLDGATGVAAEYSNQQGPDAAFWESQCAKIERAARAVDAVKL